MKAPLVLPDSMLKMMDPKDRAALGKAGRTAEEALLAQNAKSEGELQSQVAQWLRLYDVPFCWGKMNAKSRITKGWPDFSFAYRGVPCAVEAKGPETKIPREQFELHAKMRKSGWRVIVTRNLQGVVEMFREIDREVEGRGVNIQHPTSNIQHPVDGPAAVGTGVNQENRKTGIEGRVG